MNYEQTEEYFTNDPWDTGQSNSIDIAGVRFILTCFACPEQYQAYYNDVQVGYVRLRWGTLRCDYPDCGGERVYQVEFEEQFKGTFDNHEERVVHLTAIARVLKEKIDDQKTDVVLPQI